MVLRDRPSASFRSKPALNALAPPVSTTTDVSLSSSKPLCGVGELTQRLGRQRVDAVATVEPHHGDAPLEPEPLFYPYEVRQYPRSLPAAF